MWQEDPGEWRGTVRHVQSQAQQGFTRIEQVSRFIQQHTIGADKRQAAQNPAPRAAFHFNLGFSRHTTRMMALALALIVLAVVGLLAVGQGNVSQILGFGR